MTRPDVPPCGCAVPGTTGAESCYCSVEHLLEIIRRRYSLAVMAAIRSRGQARYHEIAHSLPQASSSTLAETLRALETAQLVRRAVAEMDPAHPVYGLTASGHKLLVRLRGLLEDVGTA